MIIAQITDTHLAAANAADPVFRARAENLRACIDDINGLDPMPDAVIHTGDMIQHGQAAEFAHARSLLAALEVPLYVTPGNRDGREGTARAFAGDGYMMPGRAFVHYAIEAHPLRLVAVDSLADAGSKGDFCHARLAALDATLAEAPARPTALFMHHPPFDVPTAPDPFAFRRRRAVDDLAAVVSRHPRVVGIFTGHMHRPWTATVGGAADLPGAPVRGRLEPGQRDPLARFRSRPSIGETTSTRCRCDIHQPTVTGGEPCTRLAKTAFVRLVAARAPGGGGPWREARCRSS